MDGNSLATRPQGSGSKKLQELSTQRQASWNSLQLIRATWPDKERLLIARLTDSYSQGGATRSRVTDGHLSTLAFERQARVAAQLPTGDTYSLTSKLDGTADLMEMCWGKYVVPNANSQFDFLTKWRMTGVYASVYGSIPVFYDYKISDTYIGPDCWIIPARNFLPQPGKNSIDDMDWCMVSSMVSVSFLKSILKRQTTSWNKGNIHKLITRLKESGSQAPSRDFNATRRSAIENIRTVNLPYQDKGSASRLELITKYEAGDGGHWITFAPDYLDIEPLRDIGNPQHSGRIPINMRHCFPLIDSIFGLGDFERGMSLQKAKDSLINLYLDGVKMSIFPPIMVDPRQVTMSTIRQQGGARWLVKSMEAVKAFESNPQGLQTFQSTYQFISSALLQQNGTTNTTINTQNSGNPAFGKTPQGLQMQQATESARDNWDRYMLEKCYEATQKGMINLIGKNQEKPINFHLFDEDIKKIKQQFGESPSFMTKINSKVSKVNLSKQDLGGDYEFVITDSSSLAEDQEGQKEAVSDLIDKYMQNPQGYDAALAKSGRVFNLGEALETYTVNSGLNNSDKIIEDHREEWDKALKKQQNQAKQQAQPQGQQPQPQQTPQFQDPAIAQFAQQMFGGGNPQQSAMQPQLAGTMPQGAMNG